MSFGANQQEIAHAIKLGLICIGSNAKIEKINTCAGKRHIIQSLWQSASEEMRHLEPWNLNHKRAENKFSLVEQEFLAAYIEGV